MLPVSDLNPTRRLPILTYLLIGINIVVFIWELSLSPQELQEAFVELSVVPAMLSAEPFSLESFLDIVRSMFFHGGVAHIAGNMLYLYLFGDNVEDRLGKVLYLVMYFVSGFVAAIAQVLIDPNSSVPLVGASGAIAGVLGGYLILFPGVKVRGIVFLGRFGFWTEWPAWIVLAMWFGLQLVNGIASLGPTTSIEGGVAFFAHIGGFVAGMILTGLLAMIVRQPPAEDRRQMLYDRSSRYRF